MLSQTDAGDVATAIAPHTWPVVISVTVFLWLFAVPAVFITPKYWEDKRTGRRITAWFATTGVLAFLTGLTDLFNLPGLGVLGLIAYAALVSTATIMAVGARYRHHGINRRHRGDAEIIARMEADLKRNGLTP